MARGLATLSLLLLEACGRLGFDSVTGSGDDAGPGGLTLTYPTTAVYAIINATPVSLTPVVSDPRATFSVAPDLPTGIVLDPATGELAGTPSESVDERPFTITAVAGSASASFVLSMTVLPGYFVDSTADDSDADGGSNPQCATTGGRCTLRAAVQTVNNRTVKQLILMPAASHVLGQALPPIVRDVVIAGVGAGMTTIRAATVNPPYPALILATTSSLALRDLTIRDFGGNNGGALAVSGGTLDVDRCAFTNNRSPGSGGVLHITAGAHARFARCSFTGNASLGGSGGGWGGVINGEDANTAIVVTESAATQNTTEWGSFSHITTGTTLRLESSTLYGNTSTTEGTLATPGGVYTLVNVTIVNNANTNGTPSSAGLYLHSLPSSYTVTNSLIAFNRDVTGNELDCVRNDTATTVSSGGGNVIGDNGDNCAAFFTATGDRLSTNPLLDPAGAGDHGGPTATVLVETTSPAVDGAIDAACPARDQRGVVRPRGAHCDVGAVEVR